MTEVLITSSVLITVIALLRAVLRDRIRPGLQYALWGLVLLRLLVPGSWFESPVSVANAADPIVRQVQQYSAENTRTVTFPVTMGELPETGEPNKAIARTDIAPLDIAKWVWLGGAAVLAAWFLFVNVRLAWKLTRERKLYSKTHKIPVYVTKTLPSPCLYLGDIYLTEEAAADPARAEYIIAHELTHRRHLDGVWSALRVVCLAVYWFNPLVWLAAVLSRRDCELFCDAATVKRLGEAHRFDYGRTLLDLTAVNVRPGDLICSATTMSGSGKSLKERIARIARNRKTSVLLGIVVVLIAAIAVGCTFSGEKDTSPELSAALPTPTPVSEWAPVYGSTAAANRQDPRVNALMENELYLYYMEYLGACGTDTWDAAAEYCWLDSEYSKNLSLDNHKPIIFASMIAFQPLCDDLIAILMDIQTENRDEPMESLNFVGRVDGKPCVFRNADGIPEELQYALERLELAADTGEEESLGPVNGSYWDEVNEVFGPFLEPVDVEVHWGEIYEPVAPLEMLTLGDVVYSTDGWEFKYLEPPAQLASPYRAYIKVTAEDGRKLEIRDEAGGMFIYDGDYIVMEISLDDITGDEFLAMLLNWAQAWPKELEQSGPSPIPDRGTPPDWEEDTALSYSAPTEPTPTPVTVESVPTTPVATEEETEPSDPAATPAPAARDPSMIPIADTPENLWGENWRDGLTEDEIARLETE